MINTNIYSQNDLRWRFKKVGYGPQTFGTDIFGRWTNAVGCTVTCLTSLLSASGTVLTPDQVNTALVYKNGFLNQGTIINPSGSLIYWPNIPSAFTNISFDGRFYAYNDAEVKNLISQGFPVLINVTWGGGHWVLALGDHMVMDPWDGKVKPFGTFQPVGYVSLTWKKA